MVYDQAHVIVSIRLSVCLTLAISWSALAKNPALLLSKSIKDLLQNGTWLRIGWIDDFQPQGRGFDSCFSRHVGTLGKSFTYTVVCALRSETPNSVSVL